MDHAPRSLDLTETLDIARKQSARGALIIAFADSRYLDVLMNWLVALAANGIDNYLVVALDIDLYRFLRERGISTVLSELRGDLSALWIRRMNIFSALCAAGIDFVHSDVDAIWMRDPRAAYFNDQDTDLTISQGTVWPPDVHQRLGFVLCCGLFQLRSTERTRHLLDELERDVVGTGDDQVSLNRLVAARSIDWTVEPNHGYTIEGPGTRFLCSKSPMRGVSSDGMRVAVLPHHLFQRVPMASDEPPYVLHLLTRKAPVAKLKEFERHRCLWLRPDWRGIEFDSSTLARLSRIE